jgi:activator of HSP90 ATPase
MFKSIEQEVVFDASPTKIYEALMDSKQHSAFTGAPAKIDAEVGGRMSCHDGMVSGINVELVRDKRIVQAWRGGHFPEGVYSIATFELEPAAGGKTKLSFKQHGVPEEVHERIVNGWNQYYWEPLRRFLAR